MMNKPLKDEIYQKIESLGPTETDMSFVEVRLKIERLFNHVHHLLNQNFPAREILDNVFLLIHDIVPFDRIGIALLKDQDSHLQLFWIKSNLLTQQLKQDFESTDVSQSLKAILDTGKPRIISDLTEYFDTHPESKTTPLLISDGIKSNLTCPLFTNSKNIGLIFFSSRVPFTYEWKYLDIYLELAGCLSLIVKDYVNQQRRNSHENQIK